MHRTVSNSQTFADDFIGPWLFKLQKTGFRVYRGGVSFDGALVTKYLGPIAILFCFFLHLTTPVKSTGDLSSDCLRYVLKRYWACTYTPPAA
jgi:hypothetical protein